MKNRSKALVLCICTLALIVSGVFTTLAYFTSKTDVVTNTFTVGNVTIDLDETDVDVYGAKDGETRVKANTYKLIPGHNYIKDPIVHVTAGSEPCYIFVEIADEITAIQAADTVATQMAGKPDVEGDAWMLVEGTANIYAYESVIDAREAQKDITVFEDFTIKGDADVSTYAGKTIKVTAYAVQKDGFDTAAAAWTATFGAETSEDVEGAE